MNTRPVHAITRMLVIAALLVLIGAQVTAVYAQDSLIVDTDGEFATIEAALAAANAAIPSKFTVESTPHR